jgi:plastocyanin
VKRLALLLTIAVISSGGYAGAHIGSHEVSVHNNYFDPDLLGIDQGETVTWTAINGGHTVTADDGSFDMPPTGALMAGDTVTWTAPARDVTVRYRCRVHPGMAGLIKVGRGSAIEPPPPTPVEVRTVPSATYPTITSATAGLPLSARIEIAPGTYNESIVISAPATDADITLVGLGTQPADVVISGGGTRNTGIGVLADGVRIQNLTVRNFTSTGILVRGVRRFSITGIDATDNGAYGVRTTGSARGHIAEAATTGSSRAGISIETCGDCDILVEGVRSQRNLVGLSATDAGALVVRDSSFSENGVGIAIRTTASQPSLARTGAHVIDNTITGNRSTTFAGDVGTLQIAAHAGVWIDGGRLNTIQSNQITGHAWGIVLTGFNGPSVGDRILDNVLSDADQAHLAWDGVGVATCFAGNVAAVSQPAMLQDLYPCTRVTVGAPYPLVDAALLAGGV